ncbi:hypothetical protein VIGAN_02194900 [Vigna angularis var. angularis]|uniref:Uncharacterized protein n=1 Tax=Vigna angularis var. angularis TaxID=157739 RepID=A0A0S3REL8_PHAAN|nr:hypothetical protein VIGAN_02194900 [Vigna angularis var. angularis]
MSKKGYSQEPQSSRAKLILPTILLQCFQNQTEIPMQYKPSFLPLYCPLHHKIMKGKLACVYIKLALCLHRLY